MYYVLRTQPPFRPEEAATWERAFCTAIVEYMEEIVRVGRPSKGLYISCDGVVSAAKRRQQRLRRFKGPWFSAATAHMEGRVHTDTESWDQNALTPGSTFMALLGSCLEAAGAALAIRSGLQVLVSTTAEPGEGEHKLLAAMRRIRPASCMIYGLDADLILLSMLLHQETGAAISLLREAQEFERDSAAAEWRSLDVPGLVAALGLPVSQIPSFVAGMSLLGNDFMPRPITKTVREGGIPQLLQFLESTADPLVSEEGQLNPVGFRKLIETWASVEEEDMLTAVRRAVKDRDRYYPTELERWTASPARRGGITALLDEGSGRLRAEWRSIYRSWIHGHDSESMGKMYCAGVAWIWDYYKGRPFDHGWCFEPHLPPLWSDVAAAISPSALVPPPIVYAAPLPDWLHLLAVLPSDSVERLLPPETARLMQEAPWYWPTRWSLFDIGRSQLWECEPDLPIPSDAVLRALGKT